MSTSFDGARQRSRNRELPLAEFPSWGLDIMMGLYGPETIAAECERHPAAAPPSPPARDAHPMTPLQAELDAVDALGAFVLRLIRRH